MLGFEILPRDISKKSGFNEDHVRQSFFTTPIAKTISQLEAKGVRGLSGLEASDSYILVTQDFPTVIEIIAAVTNIMIPHKDYGSIPLEMAVSQIKSEDTDISLINQKEIIAFLKNDVITPYRNWHKNVNGKNPVETFVLVSNEILEELVNSYRMPRAEITSKNGSFPLLNLKWLPEYIGMTTFLNEIGRKGSNIYSGINNLFVPPVEYEDIKKALKKDRVVFITGSPEYGKTFTAVRLLWEYFKLGYKPVWIRGDESTQRIESRKRLEEIKNELNPGSILYFEDPFGKTKYENHYDLERGIGRIIDCVGSVENTFVVITSREEVFKEFKKENLSAKDLTRFEKKLNIQKPSYDKRLRRKLLEKWAEHECCVWLEDIYLKRYVFDLLDSDVNLPTPLSIRDFALSTKNVVDRSKLNWFLREKSEETERSFAREIEGLGEDKLLFLAFLFISGVFGVDFIEEVYDSLIVELGLVNPTPFAELLEWFRDDKVEIYFDQDFNQQTVSFAHPSYSEALEHVLVSKSGSPSIFSIKIFGPLIEKLSTYEDTEYCISKAILDNYFLLSNRLRNLLFSFIYSADIAEDVLFFLNIHLEHLEEAEARAMILALIENEDVIVSVSEFIRDNYVVLDTQTRQEVIIKLSEKAETARYIATFTLAHYLDFPKNVGLRILTNFAKMHLIVASEVIQFLEYNHKLMDNGVFVIFQEH